MENKRFYFTYGRSSRQPFQNGWTEVIARDVKEACRMFRYFHPDRNKGFLNCSSVYNAEQFAGTCMSSGGNFDYCCREIIRWNENGDLISIAPDL